MIKEDDQKRIKETFERYSLILNGISEGRENVRRNVKCFAGIYSDVKHTIDAKDLNLSSTNLKKGKELEKKFEYFADKDMIDSIYENGIKMRINRPIGTVPNWGFF